MADATVIRHSHRISLVRFRSGKARALRSRAEEERTSSLRSTTSAQSKLLLPPLVPPLLLRLTRTRRWSGVGKGLHPERHG
jgi:hypothetical protein